MFSRRTVVEGFLTTLAWHEGNGTPALEDRYQLKDEYFKAWVPDIEALWPDWYELLLPKMARAWANGDDYNATHGFKRDLGARLNAYEMLCV